MVRPDARHSVIKLVADLVDGDAVDRGLLAIDIDGHLRVLDIEVGGNVEQPGYLCDPVAHFRRNTIKDSVSPLCRTY